MLEYFPIKASHKTVRFCRDEKAPEFLLSQLSFKFKKLFNKLKGLDLYIFFAIVRLFNLDGENGTICTFSISVNLFVLGHYYKNKTFVCCVLYKISFYINQLH